MAVKKLLSVRWDEQASIELQDVFDSIKLDSPQNARQVVETLLDLADSLVNFPLKYPKLELPEPSNRVYRWVSKWSYKLIYEVTESEVRIVKVFNTRRDPVKIYKGL